MTYTNLIGWIIVINLIQTILQSSYWNRCGVKMNRCDQPSCSVCLVDEEEANSKDIRFYNFPPAKKTEWLKKWLKALHYSPHEKISAAEMRNMVICSQHFEPNCFDENRHLLENAVPTIFSIEPPEEDMCANVSNVSSNESNDANQQSLVMSDLDAMPDLNAKDTRLEPGDNISPDSPPFHLGDQMDWQQPPLLTMSPTSTSSPSSSPFRVPPSREDESSASPPHWEVNTPEIDLGNFINFISCW